MDKSANLPVTDWNRDLTSSGGWEGDKKKMCVLERK